MFNSGKMRFRLCELFGIPLYLDISLIILLFLFTFGGNSFGFFEAIILLFSITAHELGHALTARAFGYQTDNITLSLLGGCASLIALPRKPWQEFLTAIAGPAVSFVLSTIGFVCLNFLSLNNFLLSVFWYLAWINLMLGAFNLLPGFPLDGGRVFRSAMRSFMSQVRATFIAMIVGRAVAILIAILGLYRIYLGASWGFISLLIAYMIWQEGYREYQLARVEDRWTNFSARVSPPPYGGESDEYDVTKQ